MASSVLNPVLYARLVELFDEVRISHEGIEATPGVVMVVGGQRVSIGAEHGEYYSVNCPFCGDTRGRLYINHTYTRNRERAVCYNETSCLTGTINRPNREHNSFLAFRNWNTP